MKIKAILFGSTGIIGQAVLQECIENANVGSVLLINRRSLNITHQKVKEIIHIHFFDISLMANTTYTFFHHLKIYLEK